MGQAKLVYRDIKPSNIMVSFEEGGGVTANIIDLGLAKPAPDAPAESAISIPGAFAGRPEFASPEQFAVVGVDIRSDLYSLGVVLWDMVTGQVVFKGSPAEVMYQHQHAPLPSKQLTNVPQPVALLLEILLEKDPARRFQSPAELLEVIPLAKAANEAGHRLMKYCDARTAFAPGMCGIGLASEKTNFFGVHSLSPKYSSCQKFFCECDWRNLFDFSSYEA